MLYQLIKSIRINYCYLLSNKRFHIPIHIYIIHIRYFYQLHIDTYNQMTPPFTFLTGKREYPAEALQHKDFSLPDYGISPGNLRGIPESNRVHNYHSPDEHPLHIISGKSGKRDISCQPLITQGFFTCRFQ